MVKIQLMDTNTLQKTLANTAIPEFRFYPSIGSTNDAAADWAKQGAPELAVVIADEQTAGRGRAGRQWYTPPGSSLAFSMILRPSASNSAHLTALGALAVCTSLQQDYLLPAEIKWPNDVLVHAKKVCGVLVEVSWQGEKMEYAILGIGVNVNRNSIIKKKPLNFPATDIETELGKEVERVSLLASILRKLLEFKSHLGDEFFLGQLEFLQ